MPTRNTLPGKFSSQKWGKVKTFPNKQKQREFISTKHWNEFFKLPWKGIILLWKQRMQVDKEDKDKHVAKFSIF